MLNDQTRLYEILQANPYLIEHIHVENHTSQDLGDGGFVRQVMPCLDMTLEGRLAEMRKGVAALQLAVSTYFSVIAISFKVAA